VVFHVDGGGTKSKNMDIIGTAIVTETNVAHDSKQAFDARR
jgi:hypothetical protein